MSDFAMWSLGCGLVGNRGVSTCVTLGISMALSNPDTRFILDGPLRTDRRINKKRFRWTCGQAGTHGPILASVIRETDRKHCNVLGQSSSRAHHPPRTAAATAQLVPEIDTTSFNKQQRASALCSHGDPRRPAGTRQVICVKPGALSVGGPTPYRERLKSWTGPPLGHATANRPCDAPSAHGEKRHSMSVAEHTHGCVAGSPFSSGRNPSGAGAESLHMTAL